MFSICCISLICHFVGVAIDGNGWIMNNHLFPFHFLQVKKILPQPHEKDGLGIKSTMHMHEAPTESGCGSWGMIQIGYRKRVVYLNNQRIDGILVQEQGMTRPFGGGI